MEPTNQYQRTARGPYFSDRTASDPTSPRTEVRAESTQDVDYSTHNMSLRNMFKPVRSLNNGPDWRVK